MYNVEPITTLKSTCCGPACMTMLLKYYGKNVSIEDIEQECPVTLAGWTGKNVIDVGKAHGLDMAAFQMDAEELIEQDRPAIIWWLYGHYVVFAGKDDKGQVVICNPSKGRYRIAPDTFKSFYSGVSFWNGEPQPVPASETATAEDYEHALSELGVNV